MMSGTTERRLENSLVGGVWRAEYGARILIIRKTMCDEIDSATGRDG